MKSKKFSDKYLLRIDKGEEIISVLKDFCRDNNIRFGTVAGIGAANKVVIGLFKTKIKKYISDEFRGDYEIAPLYGIITTMDNEPYLHIHANVCDKNHNSYGGHLNSAVVSATFEAVISVIEGSVSRKFNEEIGLNLLDI